MELTAILLLGLTAFMVAGSPLGRTSPTALLAGSWAFVYVLQSIFASDMTSSLLATVTIFTVTLSFAAGELIACGGVSFSKHSRGTHAETSAMVDEGCPKAKRLKAVILFFSAFGLIGVVEYAYVMGLFGATSLADLIVLPGIARVQMYSGDRVIPLYSRMCVLFAYPGVVLALAYYFLYKWRWWLVLPMILVLLFGMSQSGRAGTMIVLVQVVISIYLRNTLVLKRNAVNAFFKCAVVPGSLMVIVFIGGQFLREGFNSVDSEAAMRVVYSLRGYLFGGVSAFSYWINSTYGWGVPTLGKYSFSSLFSALGITPQAPGVYDFYSPIAPNGETSNIYTAYRSFIEDYSIFGACCFYFAAGVFIASITRSIVKEKGALIMVLIPLLSWLALSPSFSTTYLDSFLLSCFLPYLLVRRLTKVENGLNQIPVR
jgi:oligosaccharide repeat unit polymerase